jgi:hypothetical protein
VYADGESHVIARVRAKPSAAVFRSPAVAPDFKIPQKFSLHPLVVMRLQDLAFLVALVSAQTDRTARTETPSIHTFLFVGGAYNDDRNSGHIFKGQMYVEKLAPASPKHKEPAQLCSSMNKVRLAPTSWSNQTAPGCGHCSSLMLATPSISWIKPSGDAPLGPFIVEQLRPR